MAYTGYDILWKNEFQKNACAKDKVQDKNPNNLKLKVNETYKKRRKNNNKT